jgi:hypothetical protein
MNIKEIIDYTRTEVLDDYKRPFLWTDLGLITNFNRAYEELARESFCIIDSEIAAIRRIPLYANQTLHVLDPRVVYVFDAIRESDGWPLVRRTESFISGLVNWRAVVGTPVVIVMDSTNRKLSVYPKFSTDGYVLGVGNISFTATSPAKTITKSGVSALLSSYFTVGKSFIVSGTVSNNGVFTVASSTATTIVVNETLTDESNKSAVLQLERDAALLRVARLPLVPYTPADLDLATPPTPEIDAQWHYGLANGIAKYAFLKPDSETYDPQQSQRHSNVFQAFKDEVKLNVLILMQGEGPMSPHAGAL